MYRKPILSYGKPRAEAVANPIKLSKLRRIRILSRLPEQVFSSLFSRAKTVQLKTDQALFLVGDNGDGCYRVEEGLLKVTMISRDGNERILAFLGPGALVGEMSIIDRLPRCASVVAVRASV